MEVSGMRNLVFKGLLRSLDAYLCAGVRVPSKTRFLSSQSLGIGMTKAQGVVLYFALVLSPNL
jgi:hypothetical protein